MISLVDTVFPVTSQGMTRARLRTWLSGAAWLADYVQSGYTVTDAGGLNGTLASGVAVASGVYIARDVTTALVLTANATNHVFVSIDENNASGALSVVVNTTGTPPSDPYVKVAEVTTNASAITGITDKRPFALFASDVSLKNAKWVKGLNAAGTALKNLIRLNASDEVEVGEAGVALKLLGSALTFGGVNVVTATRAVNTGNGLTGGGDFSADRTLSVDLATDPGLEFVTGKLRAKASTGLTRDANGLSVPYGTTAGTACQGNDSRLSDARAPTGGAGGDLAGSYPSPTIAAGKRTALIAGAVTTTTNNTTEYAFPMGRSSPESSETQLMRMIVSRAGKLRRLRTVAGQAAGAGVSVSVTVRVNGADTALSVSYSGPWSAGDTRSDDDEVSLNAGDYITIKTVNTGAGSGQQFGWTLEFET